MQQFSKRRLAIGIAALASLPATSPTVLAQQSLALEEIIVTARKRQESIQDVPIAMSAFSADQMRDAGITNIKDIGAQVPGLQIDSQSAAQVWIRGIGQRDDGARLDSPVGVYIDGIYIARKDAQLLDMVDVESVQVLRGPQGTLFGKNTTGGAIVVNTRKPEAQLGGYVEGRLGNYDRRDAKAVLNVPLVDDVLLSKVTLSSVKRDGYQENITTGQETASEDRLSGALQLRWLPADNVTADWFLYYNKTREVQFTNNCSPMIGSSYDGQDGLYANAIWPGDTVPVWAGEGLGLTAAQASAIMYGGLPLVETSQALGEACRESAELAKNNKTSSNGRQAFDLNNMMTGLTIEWELNDDMTFKSITGYGNQMLSGLPNSPDNEATALPISGRHLMGKSKREQISQEFQLNGGALDERLQYTVGLFAMVEDIDDGTTYQFGMPYGILLPNDPSSPLPPNSILINTPSTQSDTYGLKNTTYAAFFQGSYDLTDYWSLTLGVRWTSEKRESQLDQQLLDTQAFYDDVATLGLPSFLQLAPGVGIINISDLASDPFAQMVGLYDFGPRGELLLPLGPSVRHEADETWEEVTPMGSLSFTTPDEWLDGSVVDNMMTYLTYSEGFKSGTFEPVGGDGLSTVDPEFVTNLELGFKLDAFDRTVRLNMAIFQMEFENMQLRQVIADSNGRPAVVLNNASESEINGVEMELTWTPVAGLVLNAGASINDYDFKEFQDQQFSVRDLYFGAQPVVLPTVDRSNEPFPEVPTKTFNLGIQYSWATDVGTFIPRLDYQYRDEIFMGLDPGAAGVRNQSTLDEANIVNARVAWVSPREQWEVAMYASNLTDEEYYFGSAAVGDTTSTFMQAKAAPRMWGMELLYRFGDY